MKGIGKGGLWRVKALQHYIPVPGPGCWLWAGGWEHNGYGARGGVDDGTGKIKRMLAHRFFYMAYRGPIPPGMCVLHKCDTRPCVNPDHLFLGTRSDNNKDRHRKGGYDEQKAYYTNLRAMPDDRNGRGVQVPRGVDHSRALLTPDSVLEIRRLAGEKVLTVAAISRRFNVSCGAVRAVISGRTWRHV